MFEDNAVWSLSLRAGPQRKCGEQSHASTKWSGQSWNIVRIKTSYIVKLWSCRIDQAWKVANKTPSAPRWRSPPQASHGWPGQCRKWMQKALAGMNKDEKQTWLDPWNNQISQAVPSEYGLWNSSNQKKCKMKAIWLKTSLQSKGLHS